MGTLDPEEDPLQARPDADRDDFVTQYLDDRNNDIERDLTSYLAEFPDIADFVRSEFPKLEAVWRDEEHPAADAQWIGHYKVIHKIAEGGMGVLYLARDPGLAREVAIKTLRPGTLDTAARERFLREARIMGRLENGHLCEVLHIIEEAGALSIVMPFIRGETLAHRIERAQELSTKSEYNAGFWVSIANSEDTMRVPESGSAGRLGGADDSRFGRDHVRPILLFMEKIAMAMHEAHRNKVVHRDLKPHNIMVQPDDEPVVLDFGLARDLEQVDRPLTTSGDVLGTVFYMPPEQVEAKEATPQSDVYSLGVILYEVLTLRRPYTGKTRRIVSNRILAGRAVWPRRLNSRIPRDLEAVCMMAMDCDPNRRYASAAEFAADLNCVRTLKPTKARPDTWIRSVRRLVGRNRARVVACIGGVALTTTLVFLVNGWSDQREATRALQAIVSFLAIPDPGPEAATERAGAAAGLRHFGLDESLLAENRWSELVQGLDELLSRSGVGERQKWRLLEPRLVIVDPRPEFVFELPMPSEPGVAVPPDFSMQFVVSVEGAGRTQRFPFTQGPSDGGTYRLRPAGLHLRPDMDYSWTVRLGPDEPERDRLDRFYRPAPATFRLASRTEANRALPGVHSGDEEFDRLAVAARLIDRHRVREALTMLEPLSGPQRLRRLRLFLRAKCHALLGDQVALSLTRAAAFPTHHRLEGRSR